MPDVNLSGNLHLKEEYQNLPGFKPKTEPEPEKLFWDLHFSIPANVFIESFGEEKALDFLKKVNKSAKTIINRSIPGYENLQNIEDLTDIDYSITLNLKLPKK